MGDVSVEELIMLAITGLMAGSLASRVAIGKEGLGFVGNLIIGVAGALIGGIITDVINLDLGLPAVTIELEDVAAAILGAFALLVFVWVIKKQQAKKQK